MNRSLKLRIERWVVIGIVLGSFLMCTLLCGSLMVFWAILETAAQQHLPKIQAALDEACAVGIVVAEGRYYDHEFSGYYSPQASCFVGTGEYSCECRLTPSPTSLVTQPPRV